jgi:signal transduction histidine kinase
LIFAGAFIAVLAARRPRTIRIAMWIACGTTSPLVAMMFPQVDHFWPYMSGYTGYLWGPMLLTVPLRYTAPLTLWHIGAAAIGMAYTPHLVLGDYLGAAFLLALAGCLTAAAAYTRSRAFRSAFESAHELSDRNRDLERTMAELRDTQARLVAHEKLSALGRMLAGLSHEINNPVNIVKNNLEPVREHFDAMLAVLTCAREATAADVNAAWDAHELDWRREDLGDALRSMHEAVAHIQEVHGDLRAFIRGDVREKRVANINDGLRATVGLLRRRLPNHVAVELFLDDLRPITCHPGELNQVWLNLVQNALDAVGARGRVVVRSRAVADDVFEVTVTDDGPGIDPEFRARLFEPFATTKDPGRGTGLGLATSYQIVQRHGGRIFVDDTCTTGASFAVQLPAR